MEIRDALRDRAAIKYVRLIDPHSFCWMLIRVESELLSSNGGQLKQASTKSSSGTVYNALQKSIWEMADYAEKAVQNSGKTVMQTAKLKELQMSKEDLMCYIGQLIQKQEGRCALTGIPLQYRGEHEDEQRLASLDRIDSDGHYEKSNLQVVCRLVNFWKSDTPNEEFLRLLGLVRSAGNEAAHPS